MKKFLLILALLFAGAYAQPARAQTSASTRAIYYSSTDPSPGGCHLGGVWGDSSSSPAVFKWCPVEGGAWATVGGSSSSLTVREEDGTPSVANVTTIKVSNGTLTDNTGGSVSIATGASGGGSSASKTAQFTRSTNQALNNGSETALSWESTNWDTDSFRDVAHPERIVIPATDRYQLILNGDITAGSSGLVYLKVYVNGTLRIYTNITPPGSDVTPTRWVCALALSASDYVEVRVNQAGAAKSFLGTSGNCTLTVSSM